MEKIRRGYTEEERIRKDKVEKCYTKSCDLV